MGITHTGQKSEELLCTYTGAKLVKEAKKADAVLDDKIFIEVKKLNLNQVRPNKYIVMVAHDDKNDTWYVIPPDDILRLTIDRRGQHVPDPIACFNMGNIAAERYAAFRVSDTADLKKKIEEAYLQGEKHKTLKEFALRHKEEAETIRSDYQTQLKEITRRNES